MSPGTTPTQPGARLDGGELAELATALGRDYAVERAVSYTHLTLPTNREV